MDASAFFSSGPTPPQQQQQSSSFAPSGNSSQYNHNGSGGEFSRGGGASSRAIRNSLQSFESEEEFETLDINAPSSTTHYHHGHTVTAANANNNGGVNNGGVDAANFFGSSSSTITNNNGATNVGGVGGYSQPLPYQTHHSTTASTSVGAVAAAGAGGGGASEQFVASSGPEHFTMPSNEYTNNNYSSNANFNANNYNNSSSNDHPPPMEYEGVALQTALNTFTAVGRLGGGLATNVGTAVKGTFTGTVGRVANVRTSVGTGGIGIGASIGNVSTVGAKSVGSMMKGIGNLASNLVGGGEEDDEIANAMVQWAEEQKRLKQQHQQNQIQQGQQGQHHQVQQQQQEEYPQEGYLQQEHLQQPPQHHQPPQQQGYNTMTSNASSSSAADVFGGTSSSSISAPMSRMASDASSAADVFGGANAVTSENASAADVFGATTNAGTAEKASAADVFGATNPATSENASAADVFGATNPVTSEKASAADVFGATNAATSENASAADVFGATNPATSENASATDVFGATNTVPSENASAADVFGATTNAVPSENSSSAAADVFGASASNPASASDVFGAPEVTTTAADVFGGATYPPSSAEEVFGGGGGEAPEISTVAESYEAPPLLPEGWAKGIDEASGNTYYYNVATGESSWEMPSEDKAKVPTPTEQGHVAVESVAVDTLSTTEEIKEKQHPEMVHRQSSNQLSSLECAEHDPNFQYSDPLVGSAVAPATTATNVGDGGIAKPPATGNVLAMEIGNYHPPTAMVAMMETQQEMNVPSTAVDGASLSEDVAEPKEQPFAVAQVAEKGKVTELVDATRETTVEMTSIQPETPPLAESSNTPTIATTSPAESTEKLTITSSLAPEKRPTNATSNTHRRFQLNLPKKANLPLPPPRNKKSSGSASGGGSLGSTSRKKKLTSSPFRKPPPMEVSATPRFHAPPPAGGSSVGSGGSHHFPLPKATTPGATSVLTTSPLPTPRLLDDGEYGDVPSSASPLLPAASTLAVAEPEVAEKTESEPTNAPPEVPAVSGDGDKSPTEETKVAEASTVAESTPPVVFQPLELDQIVEAVAAPAEEFKMELPKKEVNYNAGDVNNIASTMAQEVASTAINDDAPPPTYSLTTRPIYHNDELPKAESSLFTEDGASDYQSTLRDEDLPPISDNNGEDGEMMVPVESEVAQSPVESENLDVALDNPKKDEDGEFSGEAMVSSSVATEYPMSDYQEQVTDEDFVVVDSSDVVDNNVMPSNDVVVTASPWVETVDPATGQTYYYNQDSGQTSWQLPAEDVPVDAANGETVESTVSEPSPEVSPTAHVVEESVNVPAEDANELPGITKDEDNVEPEVTEAEDEAPLLPAGWVKGIDEASGNTYYYNTVNGESSWEMPLDDTSNVVAATGEGLVTVESAAVVTESNAAESGNSSNPDVNVDDPRLEAEHEEVAQVNADQYDSPAEVTQEAELPELGPLPAGWIEATDPSGKVFYFNSSTGQSSWDRPKIDITEKAAEDLAPALADDVEDEQPIASGEEELVDESVKAEDAEQVQIENLVLAAEESMAQLEDEEDNLSFESLPPGWIETKDPSSGQIYYYNEITEESSWARPSVMAETADDPATNVASRVESEVNESDIPTPEIVEEPVPPGSSINDDANIASADQEPVEEPSLSHEVEVNVDLPAGWIEAVHEGNTYFYNEETGETSWSIPIMEAVDDQDEVDSPPIPSLVPEESPEVTSTPRVVEDALPEENDADLNLQESHVNGTIEELAATDEVVSVEELPPGWVSSIDEASGNTFYYNEVTGESKWDRPLAEVVDGHSVDEIPVEDSATVETEIADKNEMKNDANILQPQADEVVEEYTPVEVNVSPSLDGTACGDELPPGWFSSVDESTGKTFYYSENGDSSWEKPKVDDYDAASEDEGSVGQMDANEAENTENEGGVCETNEMEAVDEPSNLEETLPSPGVELPEGWFSSIDETSGKTFYYNEETGETMWDKPLIRKAPDTSPEDEVPADDAALGEREVTDTEEVAQGASFEQLKSDEGVTDEPAAAVEEEEPSNVERTEVVSSPAEQLPTGWASSIDETTGKTFYYNEETGESTWEKPSIKEVHDASLEDDVPSDDILADETVVEIEEVAHDASLEQLKSDDGITDAPVAKVEEEEPSNVEGTEVVSSTEDQLPAGWASSIDETSGKTFYYNEETGESTWEKPSIKEGQGASPGDDVPANDILADETVVETKEVEHDTTILEQLQNDGGVTDGPAPAVEEEEPSNVEETTAPEEQLPTGWASSIDETTGKTFYYNEETGESTWEKPSIHKSPGDSPEDEVPIHDVAAEGKDEVENDPNHRQEVDEVIEEPAPVEENVHHSSDESDELPPGWSSSVDEASGNIYYYNDEGKTSWDKPSIEGSRDQAEDEDETSVDGIMEQQDEVEDRTVGSVEPQGETDIHHMTEETPDTGGLPHGWKELRDEATGNVYYWNEETNETRWDYPDLTADGDVGAADVHTVEKEETDQVVEDEGFSEQVAPENDGGDGTVEPQPSDQRNDLQEGWIAAVDETSGNTYYYNEKTNETTWDKPVAETKPEFPSIATPKLSQRCRPAHAIATFGFGGRLCVMMPQVAASLSGTVSQPSSSDCPTMRRGPVVIHRVKDLIPRGHKFSIPSSTDSDTVGPLVKAKEKDVVLFLKQKSASPESLIWNMINIAAQNKGRLKNGDDVVDGGPEEAIVDLLLSVGTNGKKSDPNSATIQSTNSDLNEVQDLLLRGDRDCAVIEALRQKNYALALIIATMCDDDTYQMVARQFADDVLSAGSPLYTTTLLLTDNLQLPPKDELRDPRHGLSFWCKDPYQDLDTNWTQQLASILSNKRANYTKIIMTLGDRLMQLGHCHAAHVCYLATSLSLNNPSKQSTRMVLLGCDHTIPLNRVLMTPEAVEAFERSEAFEWARRLGNKRTMFSSLQPFKLRYAELLADVGHEALAREYLLSIRICTGIGIITRAKGNPASMYDDSFIQSLRELDDRICGSTGAERSSWNANEELSKGSLFSLGRLSALVRGKEKKEEEVVTPRPESEVDPLLELDSATLPATRPQKDELVPPVTTKPTEEPFEPPKQTDAFNASIGTSNDSDSKQTSMNDDAPASAPPSLAIGESIIDRADYSKPNEGTLSEKGSTPSEANKKDEKKKAPVSEPPVSAGLLARLFGRDKDSKVKVADVGEEMQAYYDEKLKRWIFPGDDPVEVAKPLAPPPIMKSSDKAPSTPAPSPAASNDPLAALMAPPSRATTARKGLPPTMPRYADPLASMGNMSTPGAGIKKDAAPTPKFSVFQPIPTKSSDPSKDEKENVAAS